MIIHTSAIEGYEPPLPRKGILKYLVDPEKTGAKSFVMGFTSIEPGTGTVLAQHPEEEAYYLLRGRARAMVGGEVKEVGPGTVIFIPSNARHQIDSLGPEPLEFVWTTSPQPKRLAPKENWKKIPPA
ncbi:MAG: hypothetical protein A3G35_11730 [candidate division NC10 bacterium RIFCSPLOWO2_12_FULL_66_18]|nr:MAG: hypothetical protein A3H39_19500 [candidate division NC10 bacterium RIFCSPLOWO2_02_FULL_66_22]OGB97728.1 MAG: hypothetical protein A3G35_11730 [candidate division NC10 bacterium RIFCSPLOWO2_12_FULL_66_18]